MIRDALAGAGGPAIALMAGSATVVPQGAQVMFIAVTVGAILWVARLAKELFVRQEDPLRQELLREMVSREETDVRYREVWARFEKERKTAREANQRLHQRIDRLGTSVDTMAGTMGEMSKDVSRLLERALKGER